MHAHKMRKTQRQPDTLLMTLIIITLTCSISQFDEVGAISTTTANEINTIDTTPDITETSTTLTASEINTHQDITADTSTQPMIDTTSAAQGATAISSDTATQSSIDTISTEQGATAISSDTTTQSSIDITSTGQGATAISSDTTTQSSIDITSAAQGATAISSDTAAQSSIDITSTEQGATAISSDTAAQSSIDITSTEQGATAISSDKTIQSSIDITSTEQDATAISSDTATQSSIDIPSTAQGATAISSDTATQSSIDIPSTAQDATAISSDTGTQSSIDIPSTEQGATAISPDTVTQSSIDITSTDNGATAISSDPTTQSSINIPSTAQGATAISSDTGTQSSIDTTSAAHGATAISSDTETQSLIDITSAAQGATTTSSDTAIQSSIVTSSVAQGTPATWSVAATKSVENTETTQQVTSTYSVTSSKSIATSLLNSATYETTTVGTTSNESDTKDTLTTASPFASSNATSMMTSSIPEDNDTLNVTTVVTSAKESTTGATTKIVPTTTQATPLPPHQQPPNFDAAPDFKIPFTIGFYRNWTDDLAQPSSLLYRSLKSAIDLEIDVAFQGCPGYIALSASVVRFDNRSSSDAENQPLAASMMNSHEVLTLNDSNSSVVYADYQTYFETKQILENEEAIRKYIAEQTMPRLQNATFDGSAIVLTSIADMGDTVTLSIANLLSNPCQLIGTYICSICYNCNHSMPTPTGVSCVAKCSDDLKICTVTGNNSIGCTCKDKYLPVGHGCVNQNVIYGATVGVVGAVLVGLVIAVLVLCCRLKKKRIQYDTLDSTATLSETVRSRTVHEVDESKASTSREEPMELSTFARVKDNSPDQHGLAKGESNGAVPGTIERTSSVPRDYDEISSEPDKSPTEPKHDISPNRRSPVTLPSELRDDDLPEEITHSQAFMFFDPRLNSIDANTQFSIPRPTTTFQRSSTYMKPEENDYYI